MSGSQAPLGFGAAMPDTANDQTRYMRAIFDHIMRQSDQANPDPRGGQNYLPLIQALIAGNGGGQLGQTVMDQLSGKTQAPMQPQLSFDPQPIPLGAAGNSLDIPTDVWSRGLLEQLLGRGPGGGT